MQISLNTISFASRHMGYNIILLQATGAFFTKQERANETRTLQNTSNMFQRHIHVDVAVKLNRCALTRTIFERTSGTSYLKFNLDIIAYRIFYFIACMWLRTQVSFFFFVPFRGRHERIMCTLFLTLPRSLLVTFAIL